MTKTGNADHALSKSQRVGVCSTPMRDGGYLMNKRGSDADIYPQKVLIQNVVWADPARDCVPVGVSKKQRRSEVRVRSAMRCSDRQYVAKKNTRCVLDIARNLNVGQ